MICGAKDLWGQFDHDARTGGRRLDEFPELTIFYDYTGKEG